MVAPEAKNDVAISRARFSPIGAAIAESEKVRSDKVNKIRFIV